MQKKYHQYIIFDNDHKVVINLDITNGLILDQNKNINIDPDTVLSFAYCGRCSGVLAKTRTYNHCFQCQKNYEKGSTNLTLMGPQMPSKIINYVKKRNLVNFNQNHLMKTIEKENYRRLYNFLKKQTAVEKELIGFVDQFDKMIEKGEFNDRLLKNLDDKFGPKLSFYLDIYHLNE